MAVYAGRDTTRAQRIRWWQIQLGSRRLIDLDDDDVPQGVSKSPGAASPGVAKDEDFARIEYGDRLLLATAGAHGESDAFTLASPESASPSDLATRTSASSNSARAEPATRCRYRCSTASAGLRFSHSAL